MLSSVNFEQTDKKSILSGISVMNDLLLEIVINQKSFREGKFHFGTLMSRGGRSIINTFKFLLENCMQQLSLLRAHTCTQRQFYSGISDLSTNKDIHIVSSTISELVITFLGYLCYLQSKGRIVLFTILDTRPVTSVSGSAFNLISRSNQGDSEFLRDLNLKPFSGILNKQELSVREEPQYFDFKLKADSEHHNDQDEANSLSGIGSVECNSLFQTGNYGLPTTNLSNELRKGKRTYLSSALENTLYSQRSIDNNSQRRGGGQFIENSSNGSQDPNLNLYILDMLRSSKN